MVLGENFQLHAEARPKIELKLTFSPFLPRVTSSLLCFTRATGSVIKITVNMIETMIAAEHTKMGRLFY